MEDTQATQGRQIIYTEWGLGCVLGDIIELNEYLVQYPSVKAKVLGHELQHATGKYTQKDLSHDHDTPIDFQVLKFMIKHPKTLIQLLPIYRVRGIWRINWYALVGWLAIIIIWGLAVMLLHDRGLI